MSDAHVLDSAETIERLDPEGILARIAGLPEQIEEAWRAAASFDPRWSSDIDHVIVLGMGGSGIGGSLLAALAGDLGATVPVSVVRGYALPAYAGARSLVIASSNSGNTEETVSALTQAIHLGARCVAMTTGGAILELARKHALPAFAYAFKGEPRSALGWSFAPLLAICVRAGVLPDPSDSLKATVERMRELRQRIGAEVSEATNPAKQLARRLHHKIGVFIGAEALTPVAYRWRTQVNENAKSWGIADELPEMNHNAQAGFGLPQEAPPLLHVMFLRHESMHPRIKLRVDTTADAMRAAGIATEILEVPGPDALAQALWAVHYGDYVSYYLALLNGVKASPVDAIESLKKVLANR